MTDAEKKRAKRAPNDARTAWRAMTPHDRAEFLAFIAKTEGSMDAVKRLLQKATLTQRRESS